MATSQETAVSEKDELMVLVHSSEPVAITSLLRHPGLAERHVQLLLRRNDLPVDALEMIASCRKWAGNEAIRLGLVLHPHTVRRTAMTLLRQLMGFHLVRVSLSRSAPAEVRCVAEELLIERIHQLPIAEKLSLARRGAPRVVGALLAEGHSDVLPAVLQSSFLTEAQVVRVLWRANVPPHVVVMLAEHPKWSAHYLVRLALVRNPHTPVGLAMRFLPKLLVSDLRELLRNAGVPSHLREHVKREAARRG